MKNDSGAVHVISEHATRLRSLGSRLAGLGRLKPRKRVGSPSLEDDALDLFTSESRSSAWATGPLWVRSVGAIVLLTASLGWASNVFHVAGVPGAQRKGVQEEAGGLPGFLPGLAKDRDARPLEAPAPSGWLTIDTDPPGAEVRVDGRTLGHSPLSINFPAGAHRLSVHAQATERALPLDVSAGEVIHEPLEFSMVPESAQKEVRPASAPSTVAPARPVDEPGWIRVSSPFEVDVMEKGELLGTSRMPRIRLSAGRHRLHLVNAQLGFEMTQDVGVVTGRSSDVAVVAPKGTLNVNADLWADVWLDGESIGQTPIANLRVPIGPHTLVLRHPELGDRSQPIVIRAQEAVRVGVDLK